MFSPLFTASQKKSWFQLPVKKKCFLFYLPQIWKEVHALIAKGGKQNK